MFDVSHAPPLIPFMMIGIGVHVAATLVILMHWMDQDKDFLRTHPPISTLSILGATTGIISWSLGAFIYGMLWLSKAIF